MQPIERETDGSNPSTRARSLDFSGWEATGGCDRGDARYEEFTKRLLGGGYLHTQAYHSWPQAVKMDVRLKGGAQGGGYDFVGRWEI